MTIDTMCSYDDDDVCETNLLIRAERAVLIDTVTSHGRRGSGQGRLLGGLSGRQ